MKTNKISIFHELDPVITKRFDEILSQDMFGNPKLIVDGFYGSWMDNSNATSHITAVRLSVDVSLVGKDKKTMFKATYCHGEPSFQGLIVHFLDWYDREILRFSTFNELTKNLNE